MEDDDELEESKTYSFRDELAQVPKKEINDSKQNKKTKKQKKNKKKKQKKTKKIK